MSLKSYRNKRNFKNTPEPAGTEALPGRRGALRFVVQLHHATRAHYDVRLELDGTMKSWAVPKGPSTDPLERRLAVEVEDHPIEYNDFEGIIPAGNYGAGVVMIWDEGTYTARAVEFPAKDEDDALRRGHAKGHLTVILSGQKLKGEFAMVRLAKGGRANWLMVKKHDKFAARTEITNLDRSARSGRTMGEIAATAKAEGKIWLSKRDRIGPPVAALWGSSKAGTAAVKKSPAKETPKPKSKKKSAAASDRAALPSKLAKRGIDESAPALEKPAAWSPATVAPTGKNLIFHPLYDGYRGQLVIGADGRVAIGSKTGGPNTRRFPGLVSAFANLRGPLKFDGIIVALDEGDAPRRRGHGAKAGEIRHAYVVYDLLHADGKDLSQLPLKFRLQALAELNLAHPALKLASPLANATATDNAAIGGLARSADQIYGAPQSARTYGSTAPVSRGFVKADVPAVVVSGKASQEPGSRHAVVARTNARPGHRAQLTLSNLNKLYWPDEKLTKGDLINYYTAIGPVMVPHLIDRPQSLNRHPNGIKAPSFFQKEVAGQLPGWMQTATIASGRSGKSVTYALCQTPSDLLFLANLGCIEINTWMARVPNVNSPDFVVFDLDPGKIPFTAVIETALEIKSILDQLKAPAFCKTSGGRGLHIYVPVKGAESYDEVRHFAETLCREIHRRLPATTSLERMPAKRPNLIYPDYLQNRVGSTMASIYSARPRANATVSVPLKWSEVKPSLDPGVFTMSTVPQRVKKLGDLWEGILAAAVPLAPLAAALAKYLTARNKKT